MSPSYKIILVFLLISLNAFFVAAEYSLLTLRKTKIEQYVKEGRFGFNLVLRALDNIYAFISATQLGSTVSSIILGWVGEPVIEKAIASYLTFLPDNFFFITNRSVAILITIGCLAFLQMILGELAPKAIALQKAESISRVLIIPLNIFVLLFKPFINLSIAFSNLFLKLINFHVIKKPFDYTQEEIKIILDECRKNGIIPSHQANFISNIMELKDIPADSLMIHKNKLVYFTSDDTLRDIKKIITENKHSYNRYPILQESDNKIVGFIKLSDLLQFNNKIDENSKLNETGFIQRMLYVPEIRKVDEILIEMRKSGIHVAAVLNRQNKPIGIVTLVDIVEYVVGRRNLTS